MKIYTVTPENYTNEDFALAQATIGHRYVEPARRFYTGYLGSLCRNGRTDGLFIYQLVGGLWTIERGKRKRRIIMVGTAQEIEQLAMNRLERSEEYQGVFHSTLLETMPRLTAYLLARELASS